MKDPYPQVVLNGSAGSQREFLLPVRSTALAALLSCAVLIANAQTTNSSTGTIYRLNEDSTFQQGCFAPCLCPVMVSSAVKGTFILTPAGFDGQFHTYAVQDVRWVVPMVDTNWLYTGQGKYKVGGGQQELSLYLQENGGAVQHYDSGLVQESNQFPNIKSIISINHQVCFDTVFGVSASPVPLTMIPDGGNVVLTWPTNATRLTLQTSTNLAMWAPVSAEPVVVNDQNVVTNPMSGSQQFYRLSQ